jgi:magnesium and cobalt exporter, CNNM family
VSTGVTVMLGVLMVLVITALTGYFVAQEFGYTAVDRARLRARAGEGDAAARRALAVTARTSFMLSGAQLGITVTGLVVGYLAEPMIGAGIGALLGVAGVPAGVGVTVGTALALAFAVVVQMVFGELFPKNLAIARPEPVARRLARSTRWYLTAFGWLIRIFDTASNLLLRALRIEPVHDVEQAATRRDLGAIIARSRRSGELPAELSAVLDRVLDFTDRPARAAMIPRPRVATAAADESVRELVARMASGHSRYPVVGADVDDVVGVVSLHDVLALPPDGLDRRVREVARAPVLVPQSLPLPEVLARLVQSGEEFGCVLDEYGGLAGVITVEDVAEELVGEIADEHHPAEEAHRATDPAGRWTVPGSMHVDELSRVLGHDLPGGDYQTAGGLVVAVLGRLPVPGDEVTVALPDDQTGARRRLRVTVREVRRRVPGTVELRWLEPDR